MSYSHLLTSAGFLDRIASSILEINTGNLYGLMTTIGSALLCYLTTTQSATLTIVHPRLTSLINLFLPRIPRQSNDELSL